MKILKPIWILVLVFSATVSPARAEIVDRIVAQVNDEIITLSELEQMIRYMQANPQTGGHIQDNEATRRQMLDLLIDRKLAKEEAKRLGIEVPETEVDQAIEQIKQRNNFTDNEALARALARDGMTLEQLRKQITEQLQQDRLIQYAVKGKVRISEDDVQRYYRDHYRQGSDQVHLMLIELPFPPNATAEQQEEIRRLAEKIYQECHRGASFANLARQYSKAPTAPQGGDLGYINRQDLDPRLYDYIARLRPGEVATIRTPQGFMIFKVVDRRTGQRKSLDEARPEIQQILLRQEMAKQFSTWVKHLREKALIKIFL